AHPRRDTGARRRGEPGGRGGSRAGADRHEGGDSMTTITLGEVRIDRVVEIDRSSFPTTSMLPEATPDGIARHLGWLKPAFWDARTDDLGSRIQSYVVRTPEHTILMDTCVGNDKHRDGAPAWHMRKGTFLDDLAALGVRREDVDYVVCTHLHIDHVGWNTALV